MDAFLRLHCAYVDDDSDSVIWKYCERFHSQVLRRNSERYCPSMFTHIAERVGYSDTRITSYDRLFHGLHDDHRFCVDLPWKASVDSVLEVARFVAGYLGNAFDSL